MNKIKEFRSTAGMTVRALAEKAGVAVGYLSTLENDKNSSVNPTKEVMEKIADALNKTVPEVFFAEN
ncbi:helix-turn-helix transcriptional regulator [Anaerosolibacter sp.]|uniref:helix-turn-helix transcriptional regulator n=1 Tax=Anaerosolibacter sp. TaxID=1872527 RepID=UPI0039F125B2